MKTKTTRKIIEISEECDYNDKWMKRRWIPDDDITAKYCPHCEGKSRK